MLVSNTTPIDLREGDVLVLGFQSDADVQRFREAHAGKPSVADLLRTAIKALLAIEVKYIPRIRQAPRATGQAAHGTEQSPAAADDVHRGVAATTAPRAAAPAPTAATPASAAPGAAAQPAAGGRATPAAAAAPVTGWAVAAIPSDAEAPPEDLPEQPLPDQPEPDPLSFVSAPDAPPLAIAKPVEQAAAVPTGPSLDAARQARHPRRSRSCRPRRPPATGRPWCARSSAPS